MVKTRASRSPRLITPKKFKFNQQKQNQIAEKYREEKQNKKRENFVAYIFFFFMLHFFIGVGEVKSHEGNGL